jgi:hypothetical protein
LKWWRLSLRKYRLFGSAALTGCDNVEDTNFWIASYSANSTNYANKSCPVQFSSRF